MNWIKDIENHDRNLEDLMKELSDLCKELNKKGINEDMILIRFKPDYIEVFELLEKCPDKKYPA